MEGDVEWGTTLTQWTTDCWASDGEKRVASHILSSVGGPRDFAGRPEGVALRPGKNSGRRFLLYEMDVEDGLGNNQLGDVDMRQRDDQKAYIGRVVGLAKEGQRTAYRSQQSDPTRHQCST
jgi:hypothetical protein